MKRTFARGSHNPILRGRKRSTMVIKQILIGMILQASQFPRVEMFFLKSADSNSIKDFPGMESKWMYLDLYKARRFPHSENDGGWFRWFSFSIGWILWNTIVNLPGCSHRNTYLLGLWTCKLHWKVLWISRALMMCKTPRKLFNDGYPSNKWLPNSQLNMGHFHGRISQHIYSRCLCWLNWLSTTYHGKHP